MTQTVEISAATMPDEPQTTEALHEQVMALVDEARSGGNGFYEQTPGDGGIRPVTAQPVRHQPFGVHEAWVHDDTGHAFTHDGAEAAVGTFKVRGARMAYLQAARDRAEPPTALVTASTGNHAQAVSLLAWQTGAMAEIHGINGMSEAKIGRLAEYRRDGAAVVRLCLNSPGPDDTLPAAMRRAKAAGRAPGALFIHPYDHAAVIAGQATVGGEIIDSMLSDESGIDLERPMDIMVPLGGGGLLSGIAIAVRDAKNKGRIGDNVRVFGARNVLSGNRPNPKCDGAAVDKPGRLASLIIGRREYVAGIVAVSELDLALGMRELTAERGKRIEPAGALGYTAAKLLAAQSDNPARNFMAPITGASVTDETYAYFMDLAAAEVQRIQAGGDHIKPGGRAPATRRFHESAANRQPTRL